MLITPPSRHGKLPGYVNGSGSISVRGGFEPSQVEEASAQLQVTGGFFRFFCVFRPSLPTTENDDLTQIQSS